jgi:hypothetical protein
MAADAFYPFWMLGSNSAPSEVELAEAEAKAEKAVTTARGLDDPNLESMALDALSGVAQIRGDWQKGREFARRRLTFQERLSIVEKVDAHSMVTWSCALLGDLEEGERVSAQGLAQVQPGQGPAWLLHLVVWRVYVLTLLGRWDEALVMSERARQLWLESGKPSAGYAVRGFMSAIDLARARQDDQLAESYKEILDTILMAFPADSHFRQWHGYGGSDLRPIAAAVGEMARTKYGLPERGERGLNLLIDGGQAPPADQLGRLLEMAEDGRFRPLEAQARRGLGVVGRNQEMLTRSLAIWEEMGAVPYAARVRCEQALLTGVQSELEKGLAVLERLGDRLQVSRYERRQVG